MKILNSNFESLNSAVVAKATMAKSAKIQILNFQILIKLILTALPSVLFRSCLDFRASCLEFIHKVLHKNNTLMVT
jgi:hypothetical protein